MRKNIYAFFLSGLLLMSGCHDGFLREDVYSSITPLNFYKTEADAKAAVVSIYNSIRASGAYGREVWLAAEYPGEASSANKSAVARQELDEFLWTTSSTSFYTIWGAMYKTINRANTVLKNINQVTFTTAGLKDQLIGETKFLRGLAYLTLIRFFDHIPCMTEENMQDLYPTNGGTDDMVWQLIIQDFEYGVSVLPPKYTGADVGKATAGAAHTMLAKAYLTMAGFPWNKTEYWAKAAGEAKKIMQNSQYGYSLEKDFEKIFLLNNEHGSEYIFSIECESQLGGLGLDYPIFTGIRGGNRFHLNGWSSLIAEVPFFESMSVDDKRREKTFVLSYPDYSDPTIIHTYPGSISLPHFDKLVDPEAFKIATGTSDMAVNLPVTRYSDVLLMYSEAENEANGPGSTAVEGINLVRERAGLKPLNPQEYTKETLRDAIIQERTWEFAVEGHAYFDLKRTKTLIKRISGLGFNVQDKHYVFPIPQNELDANENLIQNEAYK